MRQSSSANCPVRARVLAVVSMDEGQGASERKGVSRNAIVLLAGAAVLAAGVIGYRMLGSADDPAPETALAAGEGAPLTIAELEARAKADPLNADAWQELGFAHYSEGNYAAAAQAYRQAVEGDPDAAVLWAALGEARILASKDDPIPPLAVEALEKALALDASEPRARYYLAAKRDIDGDHEGAIEEWLGLLADTPPGSSQEENLVKTIEQVGKINGIPVAERIAAASEGRTAAPALTAGNAIPGPSQDQIAAASAIPPGEQRDMAEGMVARLEARLEGDPDNVDGWVMLMRSRMTLGQPDRASQALADAVAANPEAAARLRQEAELLGVR